MSSLSLFVKLLNESISHSHTNIATTEYTLSDILGKDVHINNSLNLLLLSSYILTSQIVSDLSLLFQYIMRFNYWSKNSPTKIHRTKREDEIWYFKSANGDGLRIPIKVKRHDVLDIQTPKKQTMFFFEFADKEFPRGVTYQHSTKSLKQPLLSSSDQVDQHVAIVLWNTILRFMGDMSEPRHTFLDTSSLEADTAGEKANLFTSNSWMSTFDKLRFIIGLGINRPHLRDEIYCQLCKQVTNNPSKTSLLKGWVLLSLCIGCFMPSTKVGQIVIEMMKCGPDDYASYCDQKMTRTKRNGSRKQPPNTLELQSAQQLVFPVVLVELNDGREVYIEVDSSTTARELCVDAADEMGSDHNAGYGIQIGMMGKHINLGSGSEKLMDAIWVCEQSARELGYEKDEIPWKIYYRKEVYNPLEEFVMDISWTDFAYNFVVNGIRTRVTKLRRRFNSTEKLTDEKNIPEVELQRKGSDASSISRPTLSSFSSVGSSNDFGLPSRSDSGASDMCNVEFALENNNSSQNVETTLKQICEPYKDSSRDVHTLEEFARMNFTTGNSNTELNEYDQPVYIWSHQTEPLQEPLLLRLRDNEELSNLSIEMFSAILVYMQKCTNDRSSKYYKMELTEKIFSPAVQHEALKDELYCEIMKQLTNNYVTKSFQQGWELMFLCTSLFSCSDDLLKEVMLFCVTWSKYEKMAMKCLTYLRKTVQTGPRHCPPHFVEFSAATKQCQSILHKVYFPDSTSKNFEVSPRTKVKDIERSIVQRIGLVNGTGYSLFIQVFSKIVALHSEDFIFDEIQQWTKIVENSLPEPAVYNKAKGIPYKLMFLKRVWKEIHPGNDPIADAVFLYPQEVSKYLRGYYKLTIEEASCFAALILKSKFGNRWNCPEITQMFEELLPFHMIDDLFPEVWRQYIIMNCRKITFNSENEMRTLFLLTIQKNERFGSAYFRVGQRQFSESPKIVNIGINSKGIHIINPKTKDTIQMFPIENILSHFKDGKSYTFQFQSKLEKLDTITLHTTQVPFNTRCNETVYF
ncbi:unconventional myosin-VIIa-like isoform X2 [Dendronephthya gigantea]|uniref:unconventional myosin-VIIa-like isoform X2 n=1 Tax=Dendronephthya gigantea TaxID=151771 RepID=UPI001069EB8C|nr:unconventional myosin-VIIa-like isoform X2 [Dendronephthya gigantea]